MALRIQALVVVEEVLREACCKFATFMGFRKKEKQGIETNCCCERYNIALPCRSLVNRATCI